MENSEPQTIELSDPTSQVIPDAHTSESSRVNKVDSVADHADEAENIAKLRAKLGIQPEIANESLEERKKRLDNLWNNYEEIKKTPELMGLFDRKQEFDFEREIDEILREHGYPQRTKISELQLERWKISLNPKFVKDGYVYLLRGDHPNLDKKGFYARTYGYGKLSTQQLSDQLRSSDEAGYAIYGDERYLTGAKPSSENKAEELAYLQSARGGSSFISTTTSIPCAQAGTGNIPDAAEQLQYEVYVLKVPIDSAMNSDTANYFGMEEDEVLVPDYISKDEVVAKFPRGKTEEIYQYLHNLLGVSKEDLKIITKQ